MFLSKKKGKIKIIKKKKGYVGGRDTEKVFAHLNGVTVIKSIQIQSPGVVSRHKLRPDVILRETVVHTEVLDPWCKALIKP